MTTNLWIAWLLTATIALAGSLAAAGPVEPAGAADPTVCGAVVDDGSPF